MDQVTPKLISLIVNDDDGQGHAYEYVKAVGDAARLLNWEHRAAVSSSFQRGQLPSNWSACLEGCRRTPKLATPIKNVVLRGIHWLVDSAFNLTLSLHRYLRSQLDSQTPLIIFVDTFGPPELLALMLALLPLPSKKNLSVWLLYRFRNYQRPAFGTLYRLGNRLIESLLPQGNLQLLTDSEQLAASLTQYFKRPVTVMPIPHTSSAIGEKFPRSTDQVLAWWPGQPRLHKGWHWIEQIAASVSDQAGQLQLIAAQSSNLHAVAGGPKIHLIEDYLDRKAYLRWFATIDLVLLPYDAEMYREQTSGIFVECIYAGKIPVVMAETWMAGELIRYDIPELVVDWHNPHMVESLIQLALDQTVQAKVIQMQQAYHRFHSVESYASKMQFLTASLP